LSGLRDYSFISLYTQNHHKKESTIHNSTADYMVVFLRLSTVLSYPHHFSPPLTWIIESLLYVQSKLLYKN